MSDQSAATRFLAQLRRQMEQIADRRARRKSGVTPGGPYGSVFVDDAGHVYQASAGAGINSAVQLWQGETIAFAGGSSAAETYVWASDGSNVVYDTDSYWSAAQPGRHVAPADGKYLITCMAQVSAGSGVGLYDVNVQIRHTNTALYTDSVGFWINGRVDDSTGEVLAGCVAGELQLTAGQYVTIVADVNHLSGSTGSLLFDVRLFTMRRMA